jgi:hypothetical protein
MKHLRASRLRMIADRFDPHGRHLCRLRAVRAHGVTFPLAPRLAAVAAMGLLALVGALAGAIARDATAAMLTPAITFGTRLDQVLGGGAVAPRDTTIGTILPELTVFGRGAASGLKISGGTLLGYRTSAAPGAPSIDRISDRASFEADRAWSRGNAIRLGANYLRTNDPLELGSWSSVAIGQVQEWSSWGRAGLGRLEGGFRTDDWRYPSGFGDRTMARSWDASVVLVRHRSDAWLAGWRERHLGLGTASSAVFRGAVVGYRRDITASLRMEVEAGGAEIRYGDGTRQQGPAASITLSGAEPQGLGLIPRLQIWQDVSTNSSFEVARLLPRGRLSVRWLSMVDVQGGFYRDPTLVREITMATEDTVAQANIVRLEVSYGRTAAFHVATPRTTLLRLGGSLARRVRPWLMVRGGGSYLRQEGDIESRFPILRRVRWDITVVGRSPA